MKIILDNKTDLIDICQAAQWHHATAVEALTQLGVDRKDAEAFTDYAFECEARRGRPPVPAAYLGPLAGRVTVPGQSDRQQVSVTLDKTTVKTLRKLGKGNLSAGVRAAARRAGGGK